MSQNDHTPDRSGAGTGGSSSYGSKGEPEYGQRVEGAPSGPSYEAPQYGQDRGQPGYPPPSYGQDQAPQHGQYDQGGQYGQYGQPGAYDRPGEGYPGQYGQYGRQDAYGQPENGYPGQYGPGYQGGYGSQGYAAQYPGQYDAGQYGGGAKPAGTGLGIAALVLGILALLTSWMLGLGIIPGLVGLVLGIVAIRKLGRVRGASRAVPIIGVVLSALGILAGIFFLVAILSIALPMVEQCAGLVNDPVAFDQCLNQQMGTGAFPQ